MQDKHFFLLISTSSLILTPSSCFNFFSGGDRFVAESEDYVRKHGVIPVGEVGVTTGMMMGKDDELRSCYYYFVGGLLKCRYVIHAVGPVYSDGTKNEDILLFNAVSNSLNKCEELNLGSIVFPLISSGNCNEEEEIEDDDSYC